jgi:hypothetical protein
MKQRVFLLLLVSGLWGAQLRSQDMNVEGNARVGALGGNGTQMVITDNNGNLGTQAIPTGGGGSSLWSENNPDIFYSLGQVGIGLSDPDATLHLLRSFSNSLNEPILKIEHNSNQTFGAKTGLSIFTSVDGETGRNGIQNVTSQVSTANGTFHGIINNGFPGGTGTAYGIKNLLANSNTPTGNMYGVFNQVLSHPTSSSLTYGAYHLVEKNGTGRHTGLYNKLMSSSTSDTALVSIHTAAGGYAAQFAGNVHITDQLGVGTTPLSNIELQVAGDARMTNLGITKSGSDSYTDGIFVSGPYQDGITIFTQFTGQSFQSVYGLKSEPSGLSSNQIIYGVYSRPSFSFGSSTIYGVYADKQSGGNGYALYVNGEAFTTGSGSWVTSDQRLKENVEDVAGALDVIRELRPTSYTYRQSDKYQLLNLPKGRQYGFIAQEVERVIPDLVRDTDVQFNEAVVDPDKKGHHTEQLKAMNYQMLIPVLTQGIKEQQKQLEEIHSKYQALEQAYQDLRKELDEIRSALPERISEREGAIWLDQNAPNPFSERTQISYHLPPEVRSARLFITAPNGQLIRDIPLNGRGESMVTMDANTLPAGLYQYSLWADGQLIQTRQMILTP